MTSLVDRLAVVRRRHRTLKAYENVFDSEDGRIVLNDLVKRHGVLQSSYAAVANESDGMARALGMAEREGERNVVLGILFHLKMSFNDLDKLVAEEDDYERAEFDRSSYAASE